jgi:hypothetical protein
MIKSESVLKQGAMIALWRVTLLFGLALVSCSPSKTPTELDGRIAYLITGSANADVSITYSQGADGSVCFTATEDDEAWYGVATKVDGEWFVTMPSMVRPLETCQLTAQYPHY